MNKQSNTGWYLLGGIALLAIVSYISTRKKTAPTTMLPVKYDDAPDTAKNTEIVLTSGKP